MTDIVRRYLQSRAELGEPELVLASGLDRAEALRRISRMEVEAGRETVGAGMTPGPRAARPASEVGHEVLSATGRAAQLTVPPELAELASTGTAEQIRALPDLDALAGVVAGCTRCPLHETRTQSVFGEGNRNADVVCVGEAPGANEDRTGRPFVGRAGKLLDRLLLSVGFPRETVYICNVLKSRPPNNRDPLPEEIAACAPFMLRQLELIAPKVIIALGAFAARELLETRSSLGSMRGRLHDYRGFPVVVTYHPAALLRNPAWTRRTWEDFQLVRRFVDGEEVTRG